MRKFIKEPRKTVGDSEEAPRFLKEANAIQKARKIVRQKSTCETYAAGADNVMRAHQAPHDLRGKCAADRKS